MFNRLRPSTISWKFLAIFIPALSLAAAASLAVYAAIALNSGQASLITTVKTLHSVHRQAVAYPLWTLDSEGVLRSMQTIATHPNINCVEVYDIIDSVRTSWPQECASLTSSHTVFSGAIDFEGTPLGELHLYYSRDALFENLREEVLTGALFFFLLASVAAIVAFSALRTIVGTPLKQLVHSIENADQGNLRQPVIWQSQDELGHVIRVYNSMIKQVDDNTSELISARLQAESLAQTKSRFLATMSHELRTPLNSIIGITEMLREEAEDESADTEPYDRVSGAGRHLQQLIDDILDYSKLEAGKISMSPEVFSLEPFLDDIVESIENLAAVNNNTLKLEYPERQVSLKTDAFRLRQIITNLLGNAFKFTHNGTVILKAETHNTSDKQTSIRITVKDSGIGISPEQQACLFEEFAQADASTTRKYGGTGLGLAISQGLCKLLGSEIVVSSVPGEGATFSFQLPLTHFDVL